jgi:hypothetical protein
MIIATIRKLDGTYLDHGNFASEEAAMIWFQPKIDQGIYGQPFVPAVYREVVTVISPAVVDENGVEVQSEVTEISQVLFAEEIPAAFEITFAEPTVTQQEVNEQNREFLNSTDWKVHRHRDQLDAGVATSLTDLEFQDLLQQRQAARASVVE